MSHIRVSYHFGCLSAVVPRLTIGASLEKQWSNGAHNRTDVILKNMDRSLHSAFKQESSQWKKKIHKIELVLIM